MASDKVPLSGSYRELPPNATEISPSSPDESVEVTVVVRRRAPLPALGTRAARPPSREEFAREYGADPADLEKIEAFARAAGLTVAAMDVATRSVVLSGTAAQMEQAFGVKLMAIRSGGQVLRVRTGMIYIPASLEGVIEAVLGLDNRPAAGSRA